MKENGFLEKMDFANEVFTINAENRNQFMQYYYDETYSCIDELYNAYLSYRQIDLNQFVNEKVEYSAIYIYNAINLLVMSTNLLISGYMIASGNLFRQSMESILIGVLVSRSDLDKDYYNMLISEDRSFSATKVFDYIQKNAKVLSIREKEFSEYREFRNFYHLYSHASLFSISNLFHYKEHGTVLGVMFDEEKKSAYMKEINSRTSFAIFIQNSTAMIKEYVYSTYRL